MMKVEYIAQSGFFINTSSVNIAIDPWLSNHINTVTIDDIELIDYVFLTHDHNDHGLDNAVAICKKRGSQLITTFELGNAIKRDRGYSNVIGGNIGGFFKVEDMMVKLVNATHSSTIGRPVGFMITIDGVTIYHMGDTGYQADFKQLGEMYKIDLLFVPIGSVYTMDPYEAAHAVADIKPKFVVPMHYNTFPLIKQDPEEFKTLVKGMEPSTEVVIMNPGDDHEFEFPGEVA